MNNEKNNKKKDGKVSHVVMSTKVYNKLVEFKNKKENTQGLQKGTESIYMDNTILIGCKDQADFIERKLNELSGIIQVIISFGGVFPDDDYDYIKNMITAYHNIKKTALKDIRLSFIMPFSVEEEHSMYAEELIKEFIEGDMDLSNEVVVKIEPYNDENMKSLVANKKIFEVGEDIFNEVYSDVTIEEEETTEIDLLGDSLLL
ncbi:MAG: hypothetical protein ACP5RS_06695 [Thermoplasmata archaeon]